MLETLLFAPAVTLGGFALLCASLLGSTRLVVAHLEATAERDQPAPGHRAHARH